MDFKRRRQHLKTILRRKKIDALLVSQPENRTYLSGYRAPDHSIAESSGFLFIPARGESLLLTDFRFKLQAEQESDLPVRLYSNGLLPLLARLLSAPGIRQFGFESHYTLHSRSCAFQKMADRQNLSLVALTGLVERMRVIKGEDELELIRSSVRCNETVFQRIFQTLSPKMSEIDVALMIENEMRSGGAESVAFDTIVAAGDNSALPHAVPAGSLLGRGRAIVVDMGLTLSGYCSDMTRSFVLGNADKRYRDIHRLVRKAQKAGINAVRAGAVAADVDRAARKIISDAGYGNYFGHSLGHGVGLAVHEEPRVSAKSRKKLKPGMVLTIEPGIYIPGWGGVRLENMVVVHEDGCEDLNRDTTWLDI
ncbi:MAG: Xaa-Pro peptidase family protein [Desulfocapsaceae bacterium]|jgi:Xaa-Pro aminopeptidase|nr:Xaa-Pro peptidase family protein [Desulfocapsaceae bacterium]